jgi:tRNA-dihydrouridine synthase B
MIGRGAIRNPWLFHQIRQHQRGEPLFAPRGMDVLEYVTALYESVCSPDVPEASQVQKMKKYMNYLGVGVDRDAQFLHQIRRVTTKADFFAVCRTFLEHDALMPLEPFRLDLKESDLMAGCQL